MSEFFVPGNANEQMLVVVAVRSPVAGRVLSRRVRSEWFLVPEHRRIWEVVEAQSAAGILYDPVEARTRLSATSPTPERDCELLAELEISDARVDGDALGRYVSRLRFDAVRLHVFEERLPVLSEALRRGAESPEYVVEVLAQMTRVVRDTCAAAASSPAEVHRQFMGSVTSASSRQIFLGVPAIDSHVPLGLYPGMATVLAGRTSSGKTRLVFNLALALATEGHRVVLYCWEVSRKEAIAAMTTMVTGIPLASILFNRLSAEDVERVSQASAWLTQHIVFEDMGEYRSLIDEYARSPRHVRGINIRLLDTAVSTVVEKRGHVGIFDLFAKVLVDKSYESMVLAMQHVQNLIKDTGFHGVLVHQAGKEKLNTVGDLELGDLAGIMDIAGNFENVWSASLESRFEGSAAADFMYLRSLKQRWGPKHWLVRGRFEGGTGVISDWEVVDRDEEMETIDPARLSKKRSSRRKKKEEEQA